MKVLVVDDSQIMRRIVTSVLKKAGVEDIVEAENGKVALDKLTADNDIDLVLLDWNMPVMTGIEALKRARAANINIPIVMVTTESEKARVLEAIKAGANDYLVKPFNPRDITEKLEKLLEPAKK